MRRVRGAGEPPLAFIGTDLALTFSGTAGAFDDGDVATETRPDWTRNRRDLGVAQSVAAAEQMLIARLKTQRGELAALGHPGYGSRHHELIGQPNVQRTRSLIRLRVLEALAQETRVERVLACDVTAAHEPPRDLVRISLTVRLIDRADPLTLVVPFSLEVKS